MSLAQLAPIQVFLSPGATPQRSFGISSILATLTSEQYSKFIEATGGLSTLALTPASVASTLDDLGITSTERAYEDATKHFTGERVPELAYLAYRGVADQTYNQTVQILPETGTTDRASVGLYALTDVEGGPYSYDSPGLAQTVTLTVEDAGGGNGATGTYTVQDGDGRTFTYDSGGFNVWTFTVTAAAAGLYSVTVNGEVYSYTASGGDSIEDIRDGVFADMINFNVHPPHPEWTGNTVSTDAITITGNNVGESLTVTSNLGPGGTEATLVETTPIVAETTSAIATGISDAITNATTPPDNYTSSPAAAVVTITASAGFEGTDLGILGNGPSASDLTQATTQDHRELVSTVRDALDTQLTATAHPSFTNGTTGTDTITMNGTVVGQFVPVTVAAPNGNIVLLETQGVLTLRTAQTTRITIVENPADNFAWQGTYQLTAFGTMVSYAAGASETVEAVRDAIQALVDANISQVTTAVAGTIAFDMTNNTAGQPFGVTLSSPNSNQAMTDAVQSESQSIADDIDRANNDAPDAYIYINSGSSVDIEVATDHIDDIQSQFPRMHFWQSSNDAMKDTPLAGATDEGAVTFATGTRRSKGVWNPEPVTSDSTAAAYEGVVSQWVGSYTTLLPGQIQPTGRRQQGFTSRNQLTPQQELNLEARAVQYMEWVPTLGASGGQVMQRRFTPSGRMIDLQRALDQIQSVYQQLAVDFITSVPIIPYTNNGIGRVHNAVVVEGTNLLRAQGLVINDEAQYVAGRLPRVSDATQAEREAGILPVFAFNITIQLGATEIPITVNVGQ